MIASYFSNGRTASGFNFCRGRKLADFVLNFDIGIDREIQFTHMDSSLAASKRLYCCLFRKFHKGYLSSGLSFAAPVLFLLTLAGFVTKPWLQYSGQF